MGSHGQTHLLISISILTFTLTTVQSYYVKGLEMVVYGKN
jgi:hypothetical protein